MARNMVICFDGTWNTPVQKDRGRVVPTNVVKMARAVVDTDKSRQPPAYYDQGVGTGKLDKVTGGGLGIGLSENILQAYRHIADNFEDDDRLFLFGFSRGAYTARSLSGLIGRCGLTSAKDLKSADEAYEIYRQATDAQGKEKVQKFKEKQRKLTIHFLGVWDTVGALGVPALSRYGLLRKFVKKVSEGSKYAHGFHDETLGTHVLHAYQALAIDEQRGPFEPSVWKTDGSERNNVEQVWFAGVHSNIGGGYLDQSLSDHAFMWMAAKAVDAGLELDQRYLALRLEPDAHGELRDSMSFAYRFMPRHERQIGLPDTLNEKIHQSALKRMEHATNNYRPANLMRALETSRVQISNDGLDLIENIRAARFGPKK